MQRHADAVIIGGGVVGLACAAALARAGRSVWLLERNARIAAETSARNSEVVHAGLHYPPGSLKARLCVAGRGALYARCEARRLPHRRIGKLVVATAPDELAKLEALRERGAANGVSGLVLLDAAEVRAREPQVAALAALASPETGIVDAGALCLDYAAEAEARGALLVLRSEVLELARHSFGWRVAARDADGQRSEVDCGAVVNAAGLSGDRVAERAGLDVDALGYRLHYCKGDYFSLAPGARLRVSRLVYPVPVAAGLGIHATLDLAGRLRFGPDAHYVAEPSYAVDPDQAPVFGRTLRRYLPELQDTWLVPEGAGVRPKLAGPGEGFRDFVVTEESAAGCPGLVSCLGIESPGLTAAPAIAERVVGLLRAL